MMQMPPMHPQQEIREQMNIRGWTPRDLAERMCAADGEFGPVMRTEVLIRHYLADRHHALELGQITADRITRAFQWGNCNHLLNLERAWKAHMEPTQ